MMELIIDDQIILIDDEDFERVTSVPWKWRVGEWGTGDKKYLYVHGTRHDFIWLHRFILDVGIEERREVDHINHNTLDNRKSNLRLTTRSQQHMNEEIRSDNTSGFKGVHWNGIRRKWVARIVIDGKRTELGGFDDKVKAALAYNEAAIKYYGEFARLNEIS